MVELEGTFTTNCSYLFSLYSKDNCIPICHQCCFWHDYCNCHWENGNRKIKVTIPLPKPASYTVFTVSFLLLCEAAYKERLFVADGRKKPWPPSSEEIYKRSREVKRVNYPDLFVISIFLAQYRMKLIT